ncbi:MAG: helix-turn-helix transcriptional regulator [Oscillospiraceae bacterium]|nr:helix-turn-helix transcriptional regulator [Oscillospiraceae bacterium]
MLGTPSANLEAALSTLPAGTVLVNCRPRRPKLSFTLSASGAGCVELYDLYPGIELACYCFLPGQLTHSLPPASGLLRVSCCQRGRIVWDLPEEPGELGPGSVFLRRLTDSGPVSFFLPDGCSGLSLTVDLNLLDEQPPDLLQEAGVSGATLSARFPGLAVLLPAGPPDHIFQDLSAHPPELHPAYCKLKAQELLMELCSMPEPPPIDPRQAEVIRSIHGQLVGHLDRRMTIEALSRQHLISAAALKSGFKAIYGQSIGSYMKEYRIREAARMLAESSKSVAEIAAAVGYENQSKFTAAFRARFQATPTAYRKRCR